MASPERTFPLEIENQGSCVDISPPILYALFMAKIKKYPGLTLYNPLAKLTDENFISKAIQECITNNDPNGVLEVIRIYRNALKKSHISRSTKEPS